MTDALALCNRALAKLGQPAIPALDPHASNAARLCCAHYHPTRREILGLAPWKFARSACTSTVPRIKDNLGHYVHAFPTDAISIHWTSDPAAAIHGRTILAAHESIDIVYIADVEDLANWTIGALDLFATRLAAKLCIPLTSNANILADLAEEYDNQKNLA